MRDTSRNPKTLLWLLPAATLAGLFGWFLRGSAAPALQKANNLPADQPAATASASAAAIPEPHTTPCPAGLIDDFEADDEGRLPACEGRVGTWYAFNDGQPGTVQAPYPGKPFAHVVPGLGEPGFALRTRGTCQLGQPSDKIWGAGIAFDLNNPSGQASEKQGYDALARGFVGLRFKARLGEDPGATNVLRVHRYQLGYPTPGETIQN